MAAGVDVVDLEIAHVTGLEARLERPGVALRVEGCGPFGHAAPLYLREALMSGERDVDRIGIQNAPVGVRDVVSGAGGFH